MLNLVPVLEVDADICVNCHSCIAVCPVKYCNDASGDSVQVIHNMCIACGSCLKACTHGARNYVDDFTEFLQHSSSGDKMIAIVAPSIAANFPNQYLNLNGWLKNTGVEAVFDVSFGAELTAKSYVEHLNNEQPELLIAQACPSIVTYIQLYQPDLIKYLAPADSPMLHIIKMVRRYYPKYAKHKVVVVSPCMAKKREFQAVGMGDYIIAIKSIASFLKDNNIDLNNYEAVEYDNPPAERGVWFSSPGGLLQTAEREKPELRDRTRKIEGPSIIYEYLNKLPAVIKKKMNPLMVDCLNCEYGCNAGPLTITHDKSVDEIEHLVLSRKNEMKKYYDENNDNDSITKNIDKYWDAQLYQRSYDNLWKNIKLKYPTPEELNEIYRLMHKYDEKDLYNCASCGYDVCEKMAIAVFNNLNQAENCHYYLIKETEKSNQETIKSKNKIANILDTSLDGFLEINTDTIITQANPALKKILKKEDVIGRSLFDFLDNINKEILRKELKSRNKNKKSSYELTLLQSDGTPVYCLLSASPLYDNDNNRTGSFAMVSDITNLKLAEKELRKTNEDLEYRVAERTARLTESIEELRTTTEIIEQKNSELAKLSIAASKTDNAILIMDGSGNVEWINEGYTKLYNYTLEQLFVHRGKTFFEVSNSPKIRENFKKCVETKKTVQYEFLVFSNKGKKIWAQTTLTPIVNTKGEVVRLVAIETDIGNLKEAEDEILQQQEEILAQAEALMRSEKRLLDIIQFMPDAVMVIDQSRNVIAWNKSMEYLSGVAKNDIIGKGNYEYAIPFFQKRCPILIDYIFKIDQIPDNPYASVTRIGNILKGETLCKLHDQQQHFLGMTAAPLGVNNDEIEGAILVIKDYTLRKIADDKLRNANVELLDKNKKITEQQKDITDSIVYASKIQNALLPSEKVMQQNFSEYFVMHKPLNIVSGDFYWMQKIKNKIIIAAADCTGHGVPGAFMSMLGIAFLNDIVKSNPHYKPNEILDDLRNRIKTSLNQDISNMEAKDGMDIALCILNTDDLTLEYAGAHNPVYIIRNNGLPEIEGLRNFKKLTFRNDTLTQINADSQPIGVYLKEHPFTYNSIQLLEKDCIYLFSDGFFDQTGGIKRKKFMSKKFKSLLLKIHKHNFTEQKSILEKTYFEWKGEEEQVDDILIIGIGIQKK